MKRGQVLIASRIPAALAALGALALALRAVAAAATPPGGLEEIIVTATRVPTSLQQTPMSVQAFTGEQLELAGIDQGRDLGIMTPNLVMNPGLLSDRTTTATIRGLPGVATYVDGIWISDVGFLQRSFVELDRVEVLRGPQGTLFGRNTNGGAVQIVTRPPAEQFGTRLGVELGEFDRRAVNFAADVPINEHVLTKWTVGADKSDGFMRSLAAPFSLGDEDHRLVRADALWRPSDRFSLRFNVNREQQRGSPAGIIRFTNLRNPMYIAYNVLAGNPAFLAQARAVDPAFPDPPIRLSADRWTPESHQQGFPGGAVGKWQTRTNTPEQIEIDQRFALLTLNWDFSSRVSLESLTAYVDTPSTSLSATDGSEFDTAAEMRRDEWRSSIEELHLIGHHFHGRLQTLLGLYYQHVDDWTRRSLWQIAEFAIPSPGPSPAPPNPITLDYVRAWGATTGNASATLFADLMAPGFLALAFDRLSLGKTTDRALFGEIKAAVLPKFDVTIGFRFTDGHAAGFEYSPAASFRPATPGVVPPGDPYAVAGVLNETPQPNFGTISTPKLSAAYHLRDNAYLYASYAEGFTSSAVVTDWFGTRVLDPEVVRSREVGLRSDWLEHRLRLNATYFDSRWDGLRVNKRVLDPITGQPSLNLIMTSDGDGRARGLELQLSYVAEQRWQLDFALGLLDTRYLDIGVPDPSGFGLQPGTPFQYAPDTSYSIGFRYGLPVGRGGELLFAGNYGWMGEYQRSATAEAQTKNPDGSSKPEPAYGILNARIVYQPADRDWQLSLFGTNLTNAWYVNGGFDAGPFTGFDFGTIGRPREVGIGLHWAFQ